MTAGGVQRIHRGVPDSWCTSNSGAEGGAMLADDAREYGGRPRRGTIHAVRAKGV